MGIILLEKDSNKVGDLFGKIVRDLFNALGYESLRLNVHKTGREIDILGQHRLEQNRYLRAECKATKGPIGGDDINKFVGALDAERRQIEQRSGSQSAVVGYFVSLAGFKDSALEQEADFSSTRVILLHGDQVAEELFRSRIVVSREDAIDRSSRCLPPGKANLKFHSAELLAHSIGLVWAIYYHVGKQPTHLCVVHADGEVIAPALARQIINSGKGVLTRRTQLTHLSPQGEALSSDLVQKAKESYFKFLKTECGEIQLDGLPADEQIGSKRLRLEDLFVPLHMVEVADPQQNISNSLKIAA